MEPTGVKRKLAVILTADRLDGVRYADLQRTMFLRFGADRGHR